MNSSMSIRITIDTREDDLWAVLQQYNNPTDPQGWWCEKAPLQVGDIAFYKATDISGANPLVVLERKAAADLGASQKDGRYREQRARLFALRGAGTTIAYIVESPPWTPTLSMKWCQGKFTESLLQHAIVRLQLRHTIPVFHAFSLLGTVQWIRRIATALVTDPMMFQSAMATTATEVAQVYKDAIHVKKSSNNTQETIFYSMLSTIPGLGKQGVEGIVAQTKSSLTTLLAMSEADIAKIPKGKTKVGKTAAKTIYNVIHS